MSDFLSEKSIPQSLSMVPQFSSSVFQNSLFCFYIMVPCGLKYIEIYEESNFIKLFCKVNVETTMLIDPNHDGATCRKTTTQEVLN
jgi:hypothetical protein